MSELSLEALGYNAAEAQVSRRIYDLTTPPEQRQANRRAILARTQGLGWQVVEDTTAMPQPSLIVEKIA